MKIVNQRNYRLESRMRENRLYGSAGGGAARRSPYPYRSCGHRWQCQERPPAQDLRLET